jgi:hypothetical protein
MFVVNSSSLQHVPQDASERRWLSIIIGLHLLLITLPYAWAALTVPDGQVWGGLLFNPDDQNVHLSWAKQSQEGALFYRDLFTTENLSDGTRPLFINLLTALMGMLSHVVPLVWVYHALRVLFAYLALRWFWQLCAQWSEDRGVRLIAVAIAAFGGGFGWISAVIPALSGFTFIDRTNAAFPMMPEAFGFASAFIFTLNIAAMALLPFIISRTLHAHQSGDKRALLWAGLAAFLLSNIHTYDAIPLIGLLCAWWALRLRQSTLDASQSVLKHAPLLVLVCTALPVLYQVVVFRGSEEFRIKALTETKAPTIWDMAISYGPWLLLAIAGVFLARRNAKVLFPELWALAIAVCIYLPVSFSRKMIEGIHFPLAFLAAAGLMAALQKLTRNSRRMAAITSVAFLSISSLQFLAWCAGENWRDNNISRGPLMPPLKLSSGDMGALHFLDNLNDSQKFTRAVLSFPKLGNYVPRETGMNVYVGHWAETLDLPKKLGPLDQFYKGEMPSEVALEWLRANKIGYVIEGEYERNYYGSNLPSSRLPLKLLHNENGTAVYAVP